MKNILTFILLFMITSLNCEVIKTPSSTIEEWYSKGVFYELFVRSFKDTNGDKYGDINGVTEKLDYIKELGIQALWLMPINDSFEKTNNYDSIDFINIDPTYGTIEDFKNLLLQAHKRDIKVIIDLVLNHTSNNHEFFIDASTKKNSKYRNWYIFEETKPKGNWSKYWHKTETGYYYAYFVNSKPDLNYKNPEVIQYMKDVMKFWLDMGVDGFRFDAVTLLVENGDGNLKNQPETYEIYKDLRNFIDTTYPNKKIFTIAESEPPYNSYLGSGNDMFNAVFNFRVNNSIIRMVKSGNPFTKNGVSLIESLAINYAKELESINGGFYAFLLSNHDLYAGNRPYSQFNKDINKTKLAGSILLTLPGIPFVYYGEELGLDTYTTSKSDRWLRNCMIWDQSKNFGFTNNDKTWTMINAGDVEVNKVMNAEAQIKDPHSILNLYKSLINIRNSNSSISLGDFMSVDAKNKLVQAVTRKHNDNETVIIYNFSDKNQNVVINLKDTLISNDKNTLTELTSTNKKINYKKNILRILRIEPFQTIILKAE